MNLSSQAKYCNFECRYSSYRIKDFKKEKHTIKNFKFKDDRFCFDKYNYKVLYFKDHSHDKVYQDDYAWGGQSGRENYKFKYIVEINDEDNNIFYLYANISMTRTCLSCDGLTKYCRKNIMYSDSLDNLLNTVYHNKYKKIIVEKINNNQQN